MATTTQNTNAKTYEQVTARILDQMAQGILPWAKPWKDGQPIINQGMPLNAITRRPYSGVNVLVLWDEAATMGYQTQGWLTFNQAIKAGLVVQKGEKATDVIFMRKVRVRDESSPDPKAKKDIWLARVFKVFNLDQVKDLPGKEGTRERYVAALGVQLPKNDEGETIEPIVAAQAVVDRLVSEGAEIREGGNEAYYSPLLDRIQMPKQKQFKSPEAWYAVLFHEFAHWTGHASRLARFTAPEYITNPLGAHASYAQEELVAELGSAFTCSRVGIEHIQPAASYIANWHSVLQKDPRALVQAASAATKVANLLLDGQAVEPEADEDEAQPATQAA